VRNALHIGNDYRVLPSVMQYPWDDAPDGQPLSGDLLQRILKERGIARWNGTGALYGTRAEVRASRRAIKRALKGRVQQLHFLTDAKLELAQRLQRPLSRLLGVDVSAMLSAVRPVYDMMRGVPTDRFLRSTYWRKRDPIPDSMDPDRDGCGLIWCSPIVPLDGHQALLVTQTAERILLEEGYEPGITVTLLTERALDVIISISYDRELDGADRKAEQASRRLLESLMGLGYYPYRLSTNAMAWMPVGEPSYERFTRTLKRALDPNQILSPKRYL
jgi:4-cresol dehydrogenase (hydroxylating)